MDFYNHTRKLFAAGEVNEANLKVMLAYRGVMKYGPKVMPFLPMLRVERGLFRQSMSCLQSCQTLCGREHNAWFTRSIFQPKSSASGPTT